MCNEKDVSPTNVLVELGYAKSTFTYWTDESVPRRATLIKIADYFGVTVDDLLREDAPAPSIDITPDEEMLLDLFRQVPADKRELVMQMIRVALGK